MQLQPEEAIKVREKIRFWSQELQDMSGRNRLLFYKDTKSSTATIELPSFFNLFEMLVMDGAELFAPLPDPKEVKSIFEDDKVDPNLNDLEKPPKLPKKLKSNEIQTNHTVSVLNKVLYNLRYTARTIQEEQGFIVVYLTFGMLKWKEAQFAEFSFAPLVLVPIQIEREGLSSPYKISMAEDDIVLNPVLQTKLSKDFNLRLPEITNDITTDQLQEFLKQVTGQVSQFEGWEVLEQATLGVFNFLTLLLIKDFENYLEMYQNHPVIQALSGISVDVNQQNSTPIQANDLDELIDPASVFQIMDADSSQQEAIEAAKRGMSFVLQGPPGTGKSQTIANIIAEFLMTGRKVLFVSQKMAALEVVQNRLSRKGLGEFCLEAHSHKMDKRKVIDSLMQSMMKTQLPTKVNNHKAMQQEIKQVKQDLNSYVQQLHDKGTEIGLSSYDIQGKIAELLDEPQVNFQLSDAEKINTPTLSKILSLIREVTNYSEILTTYKTNRWSGCQITTSSIQEREKLADQFNEAGLALENLFVSIKSMTSFYRLPEPETIRECFNYLTVLGVFHPGIFSDDMKQAVLNYIHRYTSLSRYFDLQYWKDSSLLRTVYKQNKRPKVEVVLPFLKLVKLIQEKNAETPMQLAVTYPLEIEELTGLKKQIIDGFKIAKPIFDENQLPEPIKLGANQSPEAAKEWFMGLAQHIGELSDWANFNAVVSECKKNGLGEFVKKSIEVGVLPEKWQNSFLRRFYLLLDEYIVASRPVLQKFRGTLQTEMVQKFKDLDIALIEGAPYVIKERLYANKPNGEWIQSSSAETSILRREYNKKRRIIPLRKLFYEIPNLIQALKPCLMMSPLTVCQLLDPHIYQFDLVIFDEASQIPPEYAMGAFLRAKHVVVAGDRQQLPPTNFFRSVEAEENDDYDSEENKDGDTSSYESILNACDSSGLPSKMLNWHYRSKDESLITFSNYHFYDNRLFTFPGPSVSSSTTGLQFVYLADGVYKRGAGARFNIVEARKVAELVRKHLIDTPSLSLGIVTFSMSQRKAIEAEIEQLRKGDPEFNALFLINSEEPIFIKNLENVQGDERDVIILSVGYGKDETGKMLLNFGPINREGGARRLNVAVTRARHSLQLVSSILPEDIDITRTNSTGAKLLRNYLEAARDGAIAVYKDETVLPDAEFESPFEVSVYNELSKIGIKLIPQVGVSNYRIDLAAVDPDQPGNFLLGIECDGAMYHSAATARDRDRLRQQVLEGLGWKIHRIWSRDWIQNRKSEVEKIVKALNDAKNGTINQSLPNKKKLTERITNHGIGHDSIIEAKTNNQTNGPLRASPYKQHKLQRQPQVGGDALLSTSINRVSDAFKAIIESEGPLSIRVAKDRVVEAWGTRKGSRIETHLDYAISHGKTEKKFFIKGDFLWPNGMSVPPLRTHVSGKPPRSLNEIPPEEIMVAVIECIKSALGILSEDLIRETLRLFGLNASNENSYYAMDIINRLVLLKIIKIENDKVSMVNKNV